MCPISAFSLGTDSLPIQQIPETFSPGFGLSPLKSKAFICCAVIRHVFSSLADTALFLALLNVFSERHKDSRFWKKS
jgi:hypothetical protein